MATGNLSLAPDEVAALGAAVAALISGNEPDDLPPHLGEQAGQIAAAMTDARRPLIVSGTGTGSGAVMQSAAAVAEALCARGDQAM